MRNRPGSDVPGTICECMKAEHNIFSFIDDETAKGLCGYFRCSTAEAGEVLWTENSPCEYMAIIVSGRVEIKKQTEFEDRYILVGVIGSGSIVGSLCILDGQPRAVTAEALEDLQLLTITRAKLEELISENPEVGVKLMKGILLSVSMRLRKCFDRLTTFF